MSNTAPESKTDGIKFAFYEELRINYLVDALTSLISMYGTTGTGIPAGRVGFSWPRVGWVRVQVEIC